MIHRTFLFACLLMTFSAHVALGQDIIENRYGGTIEGKVISETDSTITLEIVSDDGVTRSAVIRREDIVSIGESQVPAVSPAGESVYPVWREGDPYSFHHQLVGGFLAYWLIDSWRGDRQTQWEIGYEYTAEPRLQDEEHRTVASREVIPTSYISLSAIFGPYNSYTVSREAEQLFGGWKLSPTFVLGGGVMYARRVEEFHSWVAWYTAKMRQYAFAARCDVFPTDRMRLREGIAVGWTEESLEDWDELETLKRMLLQVNHRLDYAVDRDNAYSNELMIQYVEEGGTIIRLDNQYEHAYSRPFTLGAGIILGLVIPEGGESTFAYGVSGTVRWYPSPAWMLIGDLRYLDEEDNDYASTITMAMGVSWRF
ncbi:MAG: hypothetical protein C0600_00380 [Ignavibacteria bacterium]|nr:MAG: hypothetical protein C0600_00380 [Ignavibacteria bacterium]